MFEEMRIVGVVTAQLHIFQMLKKGKRWIVIPFLVATGSREYTLDPNEHSAAQWVTWEELRQIPQAACRYDFNLISTVMQEHFMKKAGQTPAF